MVIGEHLNTYKLTTQFMNLRNQDFNIYVFYYNLTKCMADEFHKLNNIQDMEVVFIMTFDSVLLFQ